MARANVISIETREEPKPVAVVVAPWKALGFENERDMLLDDLKALNGRVKDSGTPAHAIAALSKRKQDVFEQIKALDAGVDEESEILDDSDDEAFDIG